MSRVVAGMVTAVDPQPAASMLPSAGIHPFLPPLLVRFEEDPDQAFRLPPEATAFQRWATYTAFELKRPLSIVVEDGVITNVDLPVVGRVSHFEPEENGSARVGIDSSPEVLRLTAQHNASATWKQAVDTIMMVTSDGRGSILDARPAPPGAQYLAPVFDQTGLQPRTSLDITTVKFAAVQDLFRDVWDRRCRLESPTGCIPFDYPDTGCDARAHELCDRLLTSSVVAGKVWVFTPMRIYTRNYQKSCYIGWWFHVAPFVSVAGSWTSGWKRTDYVLDPALFDHPVTLSDFVSALNADAKSIGFSAKEVYQVSRAGGGSRARPTDVPYVLEKCRLKAIERSPQPPYCP